MWRTIRTTTGLIGTCPVKRTGHSPRVISSHWRCLFISVKASCIETLCVVEVLHWDCCITYAFCKTPCTFTKATPPLNSCPWDWHNELDRIPNECGDGGGGNIDGWTTFCTDCWICCIEINGGVCIDAVLPNTGVATGVPCGVPCWLGDDWLLWLLTEM